MSPETERSTCQLCGSSEAEPLVVGYDRMGATARDYLYVRCGSCGLARQEPIPEPGEISSFYHQDYGPHTGASRRKKDRWINRMARRYYYGVESVDGPMLPRLAFRLLSGRVMREMRPPHGENRLLDVGCGAGNLLRKYRDLGWRVSGIEVSPEACEVARSRGLDVHEGTVYDAPFAPGSFDMVILSHVIEHVLDPARFLGRAAEFLTPGGRLLLSTPNLRALGFSLFGSCWFPLDAPRHIMLFDPRTIRMLGERAGLRATRIVTPAEPRMYCESRHYERTQGRQLPEDLDRRRALLEESARRKLEYRGYRRLIGPLAKLASAFGRGEVIEAEFVRPSA